MSAPVIVSIDHPETLQPGQSGRVVIQAYDADARTLTFTAKVEDQGGGSGTLQTTIMVSDPLTATFTCDDPSVTIVQDPMNPLAFNVIV